jgi:hypothetical protein
MLEIAAHCTLRSKSTKLTEPLLEPAHSDSAPEVDVPGDGGRPDIVPVRIKGAQLLECGSLDQIVPRGELDLKEQKA